MIFVAVLSNQRMIILYRYFMFSCRGKLGAIFRVWVLGFLFALLVDRCLSDLCLCKIKCAVYCCDQISVNLEWSSQQSKLDLFNRFYRCGDCLG